MNRLSLWLPALLYVALLVAGARWQTPRLMMLEEPVIGTLSVGPLPDGWIGIVCNSDPATTTLTIPVTSSTAWTWVTSPPSSR